MYEENLFQIISESLLACGCYAPDTGFAALTPKCDLDL
jgi:hypothetical protein